MGGRLDTVVASSHYGSVLGFATTSRARWPSHTHWHACMHETHATTKERGLDIDGRDVEDVEEEEGIRDGTSRVKKAHAEARMSMPSHDLMKWNGRCMS